MKQSNKTSTLLCSATEKEVLVSLILLDLPNTIITQSKSQQHFSQLTWTRKRRRSSLHLPAPPSSPLLVIKDDEFQDKVKHGGGAATATPDTPLDFHSTESDDKTNNHSINKRSNKRSKKQYNEMIEEMTETNEVLKREVENVRKYKDNLKDLNSKYREIKEKVLKTGQSKEQSQIYQSGMNLGMQSTEQAREMRTVSYQQPLIENLMARNYPYSLSSIPAQMYSSNNGLGRPNRVGRFELPDLNVSAEDAGVISQSQPLDVERDGRARYREARRMRRGLMKVKKIRNAYGIRLPQHY